MVIDRTNCYDARMNVLSARFQLFVLLPLLLVALWGASFYELARSEREQVRDAETATAFQAQAFAENTLASIKRLDELLLDLRANWIDTPERFAATIKARQEHIGDITFQIAIIDADGYLAYSNLAPATDRVHLGEREHFRVHKESGEDRLFISKPLKGKVSGKWSLQFTRPIRVNGIFRGVIVASISPTTFSAFHNNLSLGPNGIIAIARENGEIMARYPEVEDFFGKVITGPFSQPEAPMAGNFRRFAQLDGVERIYGYYKLKSYGLSFFVAESVDYLMHGQQRHRRAVLATTTAISLILVGLILWLYRALAVREKTLAQLRASEEKQRLLSTAVAQSNASVVVTDTDGAIVFVNDAFVATAGYTLAEVQGQNPRLLKSGLTDPAIYEELWRTITAGLPWQGELQNRKKNGELYWESATISPVTDEAGTITHYIAVKENITDRKRQEVELRHAKEDAEAANIAKSQFLATMSHEIRTPMNGILGMAQLLLLPGISDDEREDYARTILNSGNTLQALLNDILDLSKVEAGKLELTRAVFDPRQMLEETAALFGEPARRKGLSIDAVWLGEPAGRYWADQIRLRQMLSNLVSNAIKFTDHGSIHIEGRETRSADNESELLFAVVDTGIGIAADKQALLFQPFSQVDGSNKRRHTGTGLGLSIVRNLAELMQGEAGVDSVEGQGSRFWFRIKAEAVAAGSDSRQTERPPGDGPAAPTPEGRQRIMVVEDTPTNRKVIAAMLGKYGYTVVGFDNGRLAVDALAAGENPDLILMDCQMPEMDGFEATAAIRQHEREQGLPRRPIIALTAGAFEEDREHCLAVGMDDFLSKPVDLNRLLETIRRWLRRPTSRI